MMMKDQLKSFPEASWVIVLGFNSQNMDLEILFHKFWGLTDSLIEVTSDLVGNDMFFVDIKTGTYLFFRFHLSFQRCKCKHHRNKK